MVKARCVVCQDVHGFADFRSLPCGHCYCHTCVALIPLNDRRRRVCPTCRKEHLQSQQSRIYIDLVEGVEGDAEHVASGLERMAQEPHLQQPTNVARATQKLDRLAAALPPGDVTDRLFTAIEDFRSRIEPAFRRLEEQAREIDALKSAAERRLGALKGLNDSLEKERCETTKVSRQLADTTKKLDAALDCADRSRKWAEELEAEKLEVQRRCDDARRAPAERTEAHDKLATDNKRYMGMLDNQKNTIERYRREKAELKKELASLRRERDEARFEMDSMTLGPQSDMTFDDLSEFSAPSSSLARPTHSSSRPLASSSRVPSSTGHHPSAAHPPPTRRNPFTLNPPLANATTLTAATISATHPASSSTHPPSSPSLSLSLSLTAPPASPPAYTPIEDDFDDCAPFRSEWSATGMKAGSLARGARLGVKRKLAQREDAPAVSATGLAKPPSSNPSSVSHPLSMSKPPSASMSKPLSLLRLDRNGRPLGAMACGPKRARRVPSA